MKRAFIILSLISIFTSCNEQETLQTYIVEKQDQPGFMSVDLPMSLIQFNTNNIPSDVKDAYKSIKKINLLGLPYLNNNEEYQNEKEAISSILDNSNLYKKLMKMDINGIRVSVYYNGDTDNISEVIVFGYSKEIGVGIARVLGSHMNPSKITQMANYIKIDPKQFGLQQFKQVIDSIN